MLYHTPLSATGSGTEVDAELLQQVRGEKLGDLREEHEYGEDAGKDDVSPKPVLLAVCVQFDAAIDGHTKEHSLQNVLRPGDPRADEIHFAHLLIKAMPMPGLAMVFLQTDPM
ncbi:hypothetical protein AYW79_13400 [Ferroacidibacillus organovorans]|uniref:Uncharacterized protein n=1 Tax=Ferroacidibacillus organovorans TaxID=1765683 RepID=A0A853K7B3_9BACL|nr:hypothetical protein AYJ22_09725 [Ferroacidibacillus organovorans]OAG92212.1 hypothetical protein AYW79_13400 [Ferroacidibacillus organovorans]